MALSALTLAACGGSDGGEADESAPTAGAERADLAPMKQFLTEHTEALVAETAALHDDAERYYALAEEAGLDYRRLLAEDRGEVAALIDRMQATYRRANPAYEEMEGIVAGVPELAEYDVIIDAGAPVEDDPQGAVPFDLELPDGEVLKQPGNFFFLVETSLFGTNPEFAAGGVEPDLDGDGEVRFGEALPDAEFLLAATTDFESYARELEQSAAEFEPGLTDAMGAVVIMTPTMSEYFGQWKNSRFVSESGATEPAFVATSRLSDIADILEGLVLVYDGIEPAIAESDPQRAALTGRQLDDLHRFAAELRDRESKGEKFTAEQADVLGSNAQEQAEQIAGQVTQAAARLEVELPEA